MPRHKCRSCGGFDKVGVSQLRIYMRTKQWQWRMILCTECMLGLMKMLDDFSESRTDGLWNPDRSPMWEIIK